MIFEAVAVVTLIELVAFGLVSVNTSFAFGCVSNWTHNGAIPTGWVTLPPIPWFTILLTLPNTLEVAFSWIFWLLGTRDILWPITNEKIRIK